MAPKPSPALALRTSAAARRRQQAERPADDDDPERPRLRLVVTKGRLGVELERPFALGPVRVDALGLHLPDVRFPVELTGGVTAFRNRRGVLDRLAITLAPAPLREWVALRLRGLLGAGLPDVLVAPLESGWLVGVAVAEAALAFELLVAPLGGDLRLLPIGARGLGLEAPALAVALRATEALVRPIGRRRGGVVLIEGAVRTVARSLLPLAGMRAPATAAVEWCAPTHTIGETTLRATDEGAVALSEPVVRGVELAVLAFEGDEALCTGDLDRARREYLRALSQAPRHEALVERVAAIDTTVGGRAEAALGMLAEAGPVIDRGPLAAELLRAVGDLDSAREAYRRAADREPFGHLAALCLRALAELAPTAAERLGALDVAVARAPLCEAVRWHRFSSRLAAGDLRGARDDAAHLEACARSSRERHDTLRAVADRLRQAGHERLAKESYERALRYLPDSVEAVTGLAQSFERLGQLRRALDLLGRALGLAERAGRPAHDVELELAKLLVAVADDRPAAIAHARAVGPFCAEAFEARLLEARWRAELGDLAGAAVALGRLAEAVEQSGALLAGHASPTDPFDALWGPSQRWPRREDAQAAVATLLLEGARLHDELRGDRTAARRLVGLALRLAPQSRTALALHRRLFAEPSVQPLPAPPSSAGARSAPRATTSADSDGGALDSEPPGRPPVDDHEPVAGVPPALRDPLVGAFEPSAASAEDEQHIEQLTERLRADPTHRETVLALAEALERTSRHLDLLALLTARIEEGDQALRAELRPRRRAVLERLAADATRRGAADDAALYAMMLDAPVGDD